MEATTITGTFTPVRIWDTKANHYTDKALAEFMAERDGDSDPGSGGYPVGPTDHRHMYRRGSDGKVFEIREIQVDDVRARGLLDADISRLKAVAGRVA